DERERRRHLQRPQLLPGGMKRGAFPGGEIFVDPCPGRSVPALQPVATVETSQLLDRIVPGRGDQAAGFRADRRPYDRVRVGGDRLVATGQHDGTAFAPQEVIRHGRETIEVGTQTPAAIRTIAAQYGHTGTVI